MIKVRKSDIPKEFKKYPVILYGAGFAGKHCKKLLDGAGVRSAYFVDDDETKQGKNIEGVLVKSYTDLKEYCKGHERVNIILTSIYGMQISGRLEEIPNIILYEMYQWLSETAIPERTGKNIYSEEEIRDFKEHTEELEKYLCDEESKKVFHNLFQYLKTGDGGYIAEVCSREEQYFIKEVMEYFSRVQRDIAIIDAGAYEGELVRAILEKEMHVKEWYCFELEKRNYEKLLLNAKENSFEGKQVCINKGLWDRRATLQVQGEGVFSRAVEGIGVEGNVDMISIDEYFKDLHIDMIKMDIEGAEMKALLGGMKTIKRDRPVLAISIYHSIKDFYEILQLFLAELSNYRYYVRQHSMIFTETVLYAIPQ